MYQPKSDDFDVCQSLLANFFGVPKAVDKNLANYTCAVDAAPCANDTQLETFEVCELNWPLLVDVSRTALVEAMIWAESTTFLPEKAGTTLLGKTDLRRVSNKFLGAERVRFLAVPEGEDAKRERLEWMWHAQSASNEVDLLDRSREATELMLSQVALNAEFDPETLAEQLESLTGPHPDLVAALFRGDVDDVPRLIDEAVMGGAVPKFLVEPAAWMLVCWGALEQQREACLGWRLIHERLDAVWGSEIRPHWTIGQILQPKIEQHAHAQMWTDYYRENIHKNINWITDKRTINALERNLKLMGLGWINRSSERDIISSFGKERISNILPLLDHFSSVAGYYDKRYHSIMLGANRASRAGQRADMLTARISAVHRTAIVCARTYNLAVLAAEAETTDHLRAMLHAHLPDVLLKSGKGRESVAKQRLRQLFHVVRTEFLRDGGHLPKDKNVMGEDEENALPLELSDNNSRRGHEIFDACLAELKKQPSNWQFITSFGWQCHGRRLRSRS